MLNALILAREDARSATLHADTRTAFDHLWALQRTSGDAAGAWPWLRLGLEPWEGRDSRVLRSRARRAGRRHGARRLRGRGGRCRPRFRTCAGFSRASTRQQPLSTGSCVVGVDEAARLMDDAQQASLAEELLRAQQWDGGWSLSVLHRAGGTSSVRRMWTKSDGYATGLVAFVLLTLNTPADDPRLRRALDWLVGAQDEAGGFWPAESLNTRRPAGSDAARFMTDAASAYAALALDEASSRQIRR